MLIPARNPAGWRTALAFLVACLVVVGVIVSRPPSAPARSLDIYAYPPGQAPAEAYAAYRNPPPDPSRMALVLALLVLVVLPAQFVVRSLTQKD